MHVAVEQLNSPIQVGYPIESSSDTQAHALNQANFLSLSTPDNLQNLVEQGKVLQLSIQPEIDQLTQLQSSGHDGYLSITLPVVGVTDYLNAEGAHTATQAFGSVVGLNQFLADSEQPHYSRPDFIMAKDIVGNEYEILVEPNGKVALPEEGTGKFSLLSEIKLMYSMDQVLEGRGLTEATPSLSGSGHLYLLPPIGFQGKYAPIISVSETQEDFSEKLVSSRKIPVLLEGEDQHHFSESSLHQVSKFLFTEFDFTKAILAGDELGVKHTNGLNDFVLSPEAIGVYYDLWLNGVVTHQINPDDFLSRVNLQELLDIQNLDNLGLSALEQSNMHLLINKAKSGDFSGLESLYDAPAVVHPTYSIHHPENTSDSIVSNKTIALTLNDVFSPDHHGATISGFNVHEDKLDLSALLQKLPTLHFQYLSADLQGHDVKIHYQDPATGQVQTLATLVNAAPDNILPELGHYLNLNND
jgi:hypothetical protein